MHPASAVSAGWWHCRNILSILLKTVIIRDVHSWEHESVVLTDVEEVLLGPFSPPFPAK